ncbi:N-acetylmuramoyl-L-alanine amidase [Halanaerobacter jeridensis]|uniref:N-acetylmuramoyl-L-alanine amidase n=1 Tax=Halanaerobacter jeridensis TaxID=706427 RepID=A0A939BPJ1_9FIRM|nr:N-acetylmuramoyl-L-alanine amidase [Halanaerobacter jeridensis]MBM7556913.1 N-acetylmuramoyl-L-alanine amidase [Halanaerobacter jeridensis]
MRKLIILVIAVIILSCPVIAEAESTFAINNRVITTPEIIKGRSLIPVRTLKSFFGEDLDWQSQEKKLIVSSPDYNLQLQAGNKVAAINERPLPLEISPRLIADQLYIPVRLLTELYGGQLHWVAREKMVNYSYQSHSNFAPNDPRKDSQVQESSFQSLSRIKPLIVLDPGHGGLDPGAIGVTGLKEKIVNLEIAVQLQRMLEKAGYNTLLTRKNDRFIPLLERAQLANFKEADLFISIHANSNPRSTIRGTATYAHWYASKDNWALAWYVQSEMIKRTSLADNGLKAANFSVLRETKMPSLLLETAFLSNRVEERLLNSVSFQSKIAAGVTAGIKKYFLNQ